MAIGRNTPAAAADTTPLLQWANGIPVGRLGVGRFGPLVGFHSEIGRDAQFDAVMIAAGVARATIKHKRNGGVAEVQHWYFGEKLTLYPITSGPPFTTIGGLVARAAATVDAGLGVRWSPGERSNLAVRCVLALPGAGDELPEPVIVQLATKSRATDMLLAALITHVDHCEAADDLVDRAKHPDSVTCHELALTLAAGSEQEWGKGDTATVVPFVVVSIAPTTRAEFQAHWCGKEIHALALASWAGIVAWAGDYATEREASYA